MIKHNVKYFFKILLKEKEAIFWAFLFPLILGTFFYLTMSNIQNANFFVPANIAVVSDQINLDEKDIDLENKQKNEKRHKENEDILAKKEIDKSGIDKLKTDLEEDMKNKVEENSEVSLKGSPQNLDKEKLFKENYDKEKIFLNVFSNLGYLEKYVDFKNIEKIENKEKQKQEEKGYILSLEKEKKNLEDEFKKFKEEKNKKDIKEKEHRLFNIYYVQNEEAAKKLLDEKIVDGILKFKEKSPILGFKKAGLYETISKAAVEEIYEKINKIESLLISEMNNLEEEIKADLMKGIPLNEENIRNKANEKIDGIIKNIVDAKSNIKEISEERPTIADSYYFTLIAMTILYQSIFIIYISENIISNRSPRAARLSMSITKKYKLVIAAFLVSFVFQIIGTTILMLFLKYVANFKLLLSIESLIGIIIIGNIFASIFGLFFSSILNVKADTIQSIAIMVTMFFCMFAGMMSHGLKYAIDKNAPIVNKLNPAALIADSIYRASVGNMNKLYENLSLLGIIGAVLLIIASIYLSKKRDSRIS